jgi:hypothetical protein
MSQLTNSATAIPEVFSFQKVSKTEGNQTTTIHVLELMQCHEMLEVTNHAKFNFPNFPEAKKEFNVVYFTLNKNLEALKGLFLGLTSIGQPAGVILEQQKELGTFSLKFYSMHEQNAAAYITKITKLLSEEIRFKAILKSIIANQQAFAAEEQLLRNELFA